MLIVVLVTMSEDSGKWRSRTQIRHIEVDFFRKEKEHILWKLKLKDLRALNRRFGQNFGIIGDVEFNKDVKGETIRKQYVTIDSDRWNLKDKNTQENRLVMRCFDDVVEDKDKKRKVGGMFRGGIELSMLNSLNLSIAAKRPLSSFMIFLPNLVTMTQIFQKRLLWFNFFKRYVFPLYPIDREPVRYFKVIGEIGVGDDYRVHEVGRKGRVATIDHKVFNIAGKYEVDIHAEDLQYHKTFPQILILTCCMINYVKEVEKIIKPLLSDVFHNREYETGFRFLANPSDIEILKNPRYLK
jgi:hypothetical protein